MSLRSSATEEILAAISKERGEQLNRGIIPNSQNKPKYSLTVSLVVGSVILVCMGTGIYLAVAYGL